MPQSKKKQVKPKPQQKPKKYLVASKAAEPEEDENRSAEASSDDQPKHSSNLLGDGSSSDDDNGPSVPTGKKFSDDNANWLKMKGDADSGSEEAGEGEGGVESFDEDGLDSGEEDHDLERQSRKLDALKHRQQEDSRLELQEQAQSDAKERNFEFPSQRTLELEKELGVDMSIIKTRLDDVLRILANFKDERDPTHSRQEYVELLVHDFGFYYGYNDYLIEKFLQMMSPMEVKELLEANEKPRPVVIRTNTLKTRRGDLTKTLTSRGVSLEPVEWSKVALQVFTSTVPIGATPEYLAGHYMLQSAASMTAVMALDAQPQERVLDMASAPGGKTTYIAAQMKNTGLVVANDFNLTRCTPLTANIHRLGVKNSIVTNYDGREFPKVMGGFDRVLLDAPCTGTGIVSRDSSVKVSKNEEDVKKITFMQKQLILSAIDSVDANSTTGGFIVYSTCSVLPEENEEVVNYALSKRHVKLVDTDLPFGKPGYTSFRGKVFRPTLALTRRFWPHIFNLDGFYVAKFKKLSNAIPGKSDGKDDGDFDEHEMDQDVQVSDEADVQNDEEVDANGQDAEEAPRTSGKKYSKKRKTPDHEEEQPESEPVEEEPKPIHKAKKAKLAEKTEPTPAAKLKPKQHSHKAK